MAIDFDLNTTKKTTISETNQQSFTEQQKQQASKSTIPTIIHIRSRISHENG